MSFDFHIDNLKGRQNYNEWSRKLRSYLVTEGLWNVVRNNNSSDIVVIIIFNIQKKKRRKSIVFFG